jgi:hypothetical protein
MNAGNDSGGGAYPNYSVTPNPRIDDWSTYTGPRNFLDCKDAHGYDAFFAGHPTDPQAIAYQKFYDTRAVAYQDINVARQVGGAAFYATFGRPDYSNMYGPTVVNTPLAIPGRPRIPATVPSHPLSIGAWVRAIAGDMMNAKAGQRR